jgi:hypothetical protein
MLPKAKSFLACLCSQRLNTSGVTPMNKKNLCDAMVDWMQSAQLDTYATLKFRNGYDISDSAAERVLRLYLNRLDRTYYGKRDIRQGLRVERFVFLHKGRSGQNTHYHIAFRSLGLQPQFCTVARSLWQRSFFETCAKTSQVTPMRSLTASSRYSLHEYGKLSDKTFVAKFSHVNQAPHQGITKGIELTRRLIKALEGND